MKLHFPTVCSVGLILILSSRMLFSIILHPLRIGWDPALHLQCAMLLANGKLPYVDMFDVNPPLIWYIDTLPAFVSSICNLPVTLIFNLFMLLLMIVAASLCARIALKKLNQDHSLVVYLGLIFGLLYFNFFLSFDFGQREQIFVLLYLPFLFLRFARYQGAEISKKEGIVIGVLGSIGICLKHYFLINAICVELFLLLITRLNWRQLGSKLFVSETYAAVAFALLYLGHFLLLPQIVKDNYFGFLVPAFAKGYQFWDVSLASSLGAPDKRGVFFLLALGGAMALAFCRKHAILGCVAAFAFSGVVPYLLQFKGWNYQDIPAFAGAVILICGGIAAILNVVIEACQKGKSVDGDGSPLSSPFAVATLTALVLVSGISMVSAQNEYAQVKAEAKFDLARIGYSGDSPFSDIESPFANIILDNAKTHDPVIFIGNAVAPGFPPTTQLRMTPGSRHLHCCILSVLQYIKDVRDTSPENERLLSYRDKIVAEYISDIKKNKPVLIFIQNQPAAEYLAPYNFDQYLKNYKKIDDVAGFTVYKLQV